MEISNQVIFYDYEALTIILRKINVSLLFLGKHFIVVRKLSNHFRINFTVSQFRSLNKSNSCCNVGVTCKNNKLNLIKKIQRCFWISPKVSCLFLYSNPSAYLGSHSNMSAVGTSKNPEGAGVMLWV